MNRKVLVITVALMAVAMLATPLFGTVNACGNRGRCEKQIEKIPVKFGGPFTASPPEVKKCGDLQIGRGGTLTYPGPYAIWDTRDGTFIIAGPAITSLWTANYVVNLKTGKGVLCYDVVITIPSKGTFEGYVIEFGTFSIAGPYVSLQEGFRYGVLRGTGDYKGWKLVISGKTTGGVTTFENYLYKPL